MPKKKEEEKRRRKKKRKEKSEAITRKPLPTCFRRLPIIFFFSLVPLPHHAVTLTVIQSSIQLGLAWAP